MVAAPGGAALSAPETYRQGLPIKLGAVPFPISLQGPSDGNDDTIIVMSFEFSGNTVYGDAELSEVLSGFLGRPLTFAELLQAEALVTKQYVEAGYINSGAFIAAGSTLDRDAAIITVEIVEGQLSEIQVTGTRRLNPNYVRDRVRLAAGPPLNQQRLLEALQLLRLDPLIESLSAELSAGARPGESLLAIQVTEADTLTLEAFANNGRAPSVGTFRRGGRFVQENLLGFGDGVELEYANTDGSDSFDGRYSVPLNARNGEIIFAGGFVDTEVVEPPFDRLSITGDSFYVELGFRQPIILTPRQELALGLTASRQQSQTGILDIDFPLSPGANEEGETRISALRFYQEWTRRGRADVFALRSQLSFGLDLIDATVNAEPPDGRFVTWRTQAQYARRLAPETLFLLRTDLQLASRALVPLEQFGLGGFQSVRGYRQDTLLTDNAFFVSAEVRVPIVEVASVSGVLQIVPFLDGGLGWNSSDFAAPDPNTLIGVGVGLLWQMERLNFRFDWGIPLIDANTGDRTLQEQGLYFSLDFQLF